MVLLLCAVLCETPYGRAVPGYSSSEKSVDLSFHCLPLMSKTLLCI